MNRLCALFISVTFYSLVDFTHGLAVSQCISQDVEIISHKSTIIYRTSWLLADLIDDGLSFFLASDAF